MRHPRLAPVVTALALVAASTTAVTTASADPVPARAAADSVAAQAFPPRVNSAWVYDSAGPGTFVSTIRDYNAVATGRHELTQLYTYGGDVEMYCPDDDPAQCRPDDLITTYTAGGPGRASTAAYAKAFASTPGFTLSPIIDGRTDAGGYLQGFDGLSPKLAALFADKVAAQVCADPLVDGIQFDIEPFDVATRGGQFHFYEQVARDFAGRHAGAPSTDPYGCVDAAHPKGRFWSVFTFSTAITPGTHSAGNVRELMTRFGNGYLMDSLYDLSSAPAGTLNGIADYRVAVNQEAAATKRYAAKLGIRYGYGIPASASAHEYTTCRATPGAGDTCVPDSTGAVGYPMMMYARAAVNAIERIGAPDDPAYLGTAVWDFGDHVSWNGLDFTPVPAPQTVLDYLASALPGARR